MQTLTGLDRLLADPACLRGRRIGIITNPTGITRDLSSMVDAICALPDVTVRALFGPEHGARGEVQDALTIGSVIDEATGLPVYSLYGEHKKPTAEMLGDIDLLIYDIQDVGCRYYTYAYTLSYVMEAAAEHGVEVLVLDRPNPINGVQIEGNILDPAFSSFVGRYALPIRHGLTNAEFARFINTEFGIGCNLSTLPMQGWQRELWFDQTALPWVTPSPNLPSLDCATVYPGTCLFEGTNMSEGRGTTHPFEWLGAPWVNGRVWAEALNRLDLPGARFRPVVFAPTYSKHLGATCQGVQVHVTDRNLLNASAVGLHMLATCRRLHPDQFEFLPTSWEGHHLPVPRPHFDLLAGNDHIRNALSANVPVPDIMATWPKIAQHFEQQRAPYLLY